MHRKSVPPLLIGLVLLLVGRGQAGAAQERVDAASLARGLTLARDRHLAEPYDPAAPLPSLGDPGLRPTDPGRLEKAGGPGERWQYSFPSAFTLDRDTGPVSLYLGPCDYPFELFLNGVVIHSGGFHQAEGYVSSIFKAADLRLPEALLRRDGSENLLALRVYPELGDEDFPPPELVLMEPRKAAGAVFVRNLIRVQLIGAATFTALLLAFYFLLLGLSGRALDPRARSSYLFFALLCLAFFAAYAEIVFQTDAIDEVLIKKISKIGFAAMLFAFPAFVAAFTGRPRRIKLYLSLIALPALGFSALFFVQPTKSAIDAIFAQVMILDFGLGMLSSLVFLLIAVLKDRARGAGSLLGGIAFVLVASVLDLLSISSGTLPYAYYTPYGFLAVVVVIFVVLARDQVRIAEDSRRQAAEIKSAARAQEELIAKVRELSGRIVESGKELETSMGEAERVIAESSSEARSAAARAGEKARDAGRVATLLAEQIERSAARIPEAVRGQTGFVARVTTTISAMNARIGELAGEASEGAASAESLAATGDEASRSVAESRRAAQSISETSTYVREVIGQVGDIADKTNTLAINTAIEAARAGSSGRGFAVIAQAIRGLAAESTERIGASAARLAELEEAVLRNQAVQAKVDEGLGAIIARGRDTAGRIARISEGILARREESSSVLAEAQRLMEDTRAVESLFNQALRENAEARARVAELAQAFIEMEKILGDQADRVARLDSAVGAALRIAAKDRETVTALDAVLAGAR